MTDEHLWNRPPDQQFGEWKSRMRAEYLNRARAVYQDPDTPACRAPGPNNAACLLNPDHAGDHYGNGFDDFGPLGAFNWPVVHNRRRDDPR